MKRQSNNCADQIIVWYIHSAARVNINPLSGIIEVDKIFFFKSFKSKSYILHRKDRKCARVGDKRKNESRS